MPTSAALTAGMPAAAVVLGSDGNEIVVIVAVGNRRLNVCETCYDRAVGRRAFALDAIGDSIGEALAIIALQDQSRFLAVGEEPTLHQHSRNRGPTQDVVAASPDPAIVSRGASHDLPVNVGCQSGAIATIVIGLDPIRAFARRRIEMDANEDRVPVAVGDSDTLAQADKHIAIACHDDAITRSSQIPGEPLGDIEGHDLFRNALPWNAAAVEPAMPGVDDHGRKSTSRRPG